MYQVILDSLISEMECFGIVSTIVISLDYFEIMEKKEISHLESLTNGDIKWLILSEKKEYFCFRYSHEPMVIKDEK